MLSCKTIGGVIMDDNIRKTKQELSIQKWKQLIEDFNNSDMTLSEWCDSNHVGKAQEMYVRICLQYEQTVQWYHHERVIPYTDTIDRLPSLNMKTKYLSWARKSYDNVCINIFDFHFYPCRI